MKWDPKNMLLHDVYSPYGSLQAAGLESIGRRFELLILRFMDGTKRVVKPGEEIPLPALPRTIQESVTILKTKRNMEESSTTFLKPLDLTMCRFVRVSTVCANEGGERDDRIPDHMPSLRDDDGCETWRT